MLWTKNIFLPPLPIAEGFRGTSLSSRTNMKMKALCNNGIIISLWHMTNWHIPSPLHPDIPWRASGIWDAKDIAKKNIASCKDSRTQLLSLQYIEKDRRIGPESFFPTVSSWLDAVESWLSYLCLRPGTVSLNEFSYGPMKRGQTTAHGKFSFNSTYDMCPIQHSSCPIPLSVLWSSLPWLISSYKFPFSLHLVLLQRVGL